MKETLTVLFYTKFDLSYFHSKRAVLRGPSAHQMGFNLPEKENNKNDLKLILFSKSGGKMCC